MIADGKRAALRRDAEPVTTAARSAESPRSTSGVGHATRQEGALWRSLALGPHEAVKEESAAATAVTTGQDLIDRGRHQPGTLAEDRLLAHELTHVVQDHRGSRAASKEPLVSGALASDAPGRPISEPGRLLPPAVGASLAPALAGALPPVRIHTSPQSDIRARMLGAEAVTVGNDILFAAGRYSPDTDPGRRLLAHELTHAAGQAQKGRAVVQRSADEVLRMTVTPGYANAMPDGEIGEAIGLLSGQLAGLDAASLEARTSLENLLLLAQEAEDRNLPAAADAYRALQQHGGALAAPADVADLETTIDVVVAMLTERFEPVSGPAVQRLRRLRGRLGFTPAQLVPALRSRLNATMHAVDELAAIRRLTPDKPPTVVFDWTDLRGWTYAYTASERAGELLASLNAAAGAVWSGSDERLHRDALAAKERYLDAFTANFAYSIYAAGKALPTESSVPNSSFFASDLKVSPHMWKGHPDTWNRFGADLGLIRAGFDELGDLSGLAAAPVDQRLRFMLEQGDKGLLLLRRAHAVQLAYGAIGYAAGVRYETYHRYQMNWDDADLDGALVKLADLALDQVELEGGPDDEALSALQSRLQGRITQAVERFEQLQRLDKAVEWAANIVSILAGAALMRWTIGALIKAGGWIAGRAVAPAAVRFVVGSLAFTTGSTIVRGGLTGRWPGAGELATQAGLDLATLGLLRGAHILVGAFYAPTLTAGGIRTGMATAPSAVMHGATFIVLWGWATTLALVETEGALDAVTVIKTVAKAGARTAVDLAVLHFAGRLMETPSVPRSTALDATITRQWEAARAQARSVGTRISEWIRSAERDPTTIRELVREGQDAVLRIRELIGRMTEASGGLTPAERTALDGEVGRQLRMLENLRQAATLGIEQVAETAYRYRGSVEEIETYLQRLQRDGVVADVTRTGRGGVLEVRFGDGSLAWFYPQGGRVSTSIDISGQDVVTETVDRAAPGVPAATRSRAVAHLRSLPPGEAGRIVGLLDTGAGNALIAWLGRLDAGRAMRSSAPFPTAGRIRELLADPASAEKILALRPTDVQAWWEARPQADMSLTAFVEHLRALEAYRGSLQLDDPTQAASIAARFGQAVEVRTLVPSGPSTGPSMGPSIGAAPTPGTATRTSTQLRQRISQYLAAHGQAGERLLEWRTGSETWVVKLVDGRPDRAWRFGDGPDLLLSEEPLASQLESIRSAVEDAESIATMDRVRASERLRSVEALVRRLDPLRHTRDERLRDVRALLDRAQPERFATVTLPIPFGPPTRPEALGRRRDAVLARAERMGLPRSESEAGSQAIRLAIRAVNVLRARNPRGATLPETLAAIEAEADRAESAMDRVSVDALDRTTRRLGPDVIRRVRRGSLAELTDSQVGDVLEALRSRRDLGEGELRGFLHAAYPPPGVRPVSVDRVIDQAPSVAERSRAMDTFGRLVDAGLPGAHEVLRGMVGSRTSWRGGLFALDILRHHTGVQDVLALEVRETAPDPLRPREIVRIYDILRRTGRSVVELKDWSHWFEETLRSHTGSDRRSQFEREVLLRTSNLANPRGLLQLHWIFRGPGPAIAGTTNPIGVYDHIRQTMRGALENLASEFGLDALRRAELLDTFDGYPRIIEILQVDPTSAARPVRRLAPDPEP